MKKISIKDTVKLLSGKNYTEVRMLHVPRGATVSGYYNNADKLAMDVLPYNKEVNVFITLNPVNPDIVARSKNHLTKYSQHTTTDKEIIRRKWLMIDLDPDRPAGVSSTDEELKQAELLMEKIKLYLETQCFTEPVIAMSGNGYHLLYPIDLPNNTESTQLIQRFLLKLNEKFSTDGVKIDTTTYNAARITKLYGTIARKGDHTEERPHRQSFICSVPDTIEATGIKRIEEVVSDGQVIHSLKQMVEEKVSVTTKTDFDLRGWLGNHGIEISHEKPWEEGGTCYILKRCPWNPSHTDKAAYVIEFSNGKIIAGCHHDSCGNQNWQTLQGLYKKSIESLNGKSVKKSDTFNASQALMELIKQEGHEFFHDSLKNGYVIIPNPQKKYFMIQEKKYNLHLRNLLFTKTQQFIGKDTLKQVIDTLEADAIFNGEERNLSVRCELLDDKVYYYLGDEQQTVFCIDENGYRVCGDAPVHFIKRNTTKEQVFPVGEEDLRILTEKHWKFASDKDKLLHDVLLVTRFVTNCPMPIVLYLGEAGSTKSTSMKMDKLVVDPDALPLKILPRSVNDVLSNLMNQYMICYDNVDSISTELSDLFCAVCTGVGYGKKQNYTDNDEYVINLTTKLNFTGITILNDRPDFHNRCVCLNFRKLDENIRKRESEVIEEFNNDLPCILGAIFKTLSAALKLMKSVEVPKLTRMADFEYYGYLISEALGYGGNEFLNAYRHNQRELISRLIEDDMVAVTVISYLNRYDYFKGKSSELLDELTRQANNDNIDTRYGWIRTPATLSRRLEHLKGFLEQFGIFIKRGKSNGERFIELWRGDHNERED